MAYPRAIFSIIAALAVVGLIGYFELQKPSRLPQGEGIVEIQNPQSAAPETAAGGQPDSASSDQNRVREKASRYPRAREITTPDGFINADKLALSDFAGKQVILIDFWTYSCINCQRTIPYLNAWYEKYKDKGLVIVGIHTPEFEFEKKYDNVAAAVQKFGIRYPVALDNDYSTWNAYGNRYWPRKYLIDIDGFVVYDHIGEGAYEETERRIQEALEERMRVLGEQHELEKTVSAPADAPKTDFSRIKSPETYFGASRNTNFASGNPGAAGDFSYDPPSEIKKNLLYLAGRWDIRPEFARNAAAGTKVIFRYEAKDAYLVASSDKGARIKILRDGKPIGNAAGRDADRAGSTAAIREERLYRLVEDSDYGEHTLEIIVEEGVVQFFAFTFG